MRKILKVAFVAMFGLVVSYTVYRSQKETSFSVLTIANAEALANIEQPDVNDCVYYKGSICEALHPTDSSKDQKRIDARWN